MTGLPAANSTRLNSKSQLKMTSRRTGLDLT